VHAEPVGAADRPASDPVGYPDGVDHGRRGRTDPPDWNPFVEQATSRQLQLFGFPPPGHPYWTPDTITQLQVRYPGLDTGQWNR
jgi:hypothetical protein